MHNSTPIKNAFIGYYHDPLAKDPFKKPLAFDNDLILFSLISESFNSISFDRISVVGGRSAHGLATPGKSFSDIIDLPDSEKAIFSDSLFISNKSAVIVPLKDKILVVYNQLLRSNDLGLAFIFSYSPGCVASLLRGGALNFGSVFVSPSFYELPEKEAGAMDFLSSLSRSLENLKDADVFSRSEPKCDVGEILKIINSASELMGCPVSVDIADIFPRELFIDRPTLMAFTLCMLSKARRLSRDRRATVRVSATELLSVSIKFTLYSQSRVENAFHEASACDKTAKEMGIPFSLEVSGDDCRASFIPYRADPSVLGFKSGIFMNGVRVTRLPYPNFVRDPSR